MIDADKLLLPAFEPPEYLPAQVARELKLRILTGGLPFVVPPDRLRQEERFPHVEIVADVPMFALALSQRFSPAWLRSIEEPSCWLHLVRVTWPTGEPPPFPFFIVSAALHTTGQYRYASAIGFDFTSIFLNAAAAAYKNNVEREEDFVLVSLSIPSLYLDAFWSQYEDPANDTVEVWRGPSEFASRSEPMSLSAFSDAVNAARRL